MEDNKIEQIQEQKVITIDDIAELYGGTNPPVKKEPYIRPYPKIGRNELCPCGSGKKFKKCCLN